MYVCMYVCIYIYIYIIYTLLAVVRRTSRLRPLQLQPQTGSTPALRTFSHISDTAGRGSRLPQLFRGTNPLRSSMKSVESTSTSAGQFASPGGSLHLHLNFIDNY